MGSFGGYEFEGCEIRAVADGIECVIVRGGAFLRLIGCSFGRLRLGEFFRFLLLGLFGLLLKKGFLVDDFLWFKNINTAGLVVTVFQKSNTANNIFKL